MFEEGGAGGWAVDQAEAVRMSRLLRRSHWEVYQVGLAGESAEVDDEMDYARRLFFAPHAVLAHDVVDDPARPGRRDNVFTYANLAAARLFDCRVADLVGSVSTQSAETQEQRDRSSLLGACVLRGQVEYSGVRITLTGKRFRINNAVLFNLVDLDRGGVYRGQATRIDLNEVSPIDR